MWGRVGSGRLAAEPTAPENAWKAKPLRESGEPGLTRLFAPLFVPFPLLSQYMGRIMQERGIKLVNTAEMEIVR